MYICNSLIEKWEWLGNSTYVLLTNKVSSLISFPRRSRLSSHQGKYDGSIKYKHAWSMSFNWQGMQVMTILISSDDILVLVVAYSTEKSSLPLDFSHFTHYYLFLKFLIHLPQFVTYSGMSEKIVSTVRSWFFSQDEKINHWFVLWVCICIIQWDSAPHVRLHCWLSKYLAINHENNAWNLALIFRNAFVGYWLFMDRLMKLFQLKMLWSSPRSYRTTSCKL